MCTGFVSLHVQQNEKKVTESSPCFGKDTQLQQWQDLEFVLKIKGSCYFLPSSTTYLFFLKYNTLLPGYGKRKVKALFSLPLHMIFSSHGFIT